MNRICFYNRNQTMNAISLCICALQDNYWRVFVLIAVIFIWLVYADKKRNKTNLAHSITDRDSVGEDDDPHRDGCSEPSAEEPPDTDRSAGLLPALGAVRQIRYAPPRRPPAEMRARAADFRRFMGERRTIRRFSGEDVPDEVIRDIVRAAGTAPSGAHTEPWTFVVVRSPEVKQAIRDVVEMEETANYENRMAPQWLADLRPFRTRPEKPYLTTAPALLLVFRQMYSVLPDGRKRDHYYSEMSVAIAAGFLIAAIHYAGLVTLTSTPMHAGGKIRALLSRPANERLALLLPLGHPHPDATVPDIQRKPYHEICVEI